MWAFKGIQSYNDAAPLVAEYTTKKALNKLGYTFPTDDLDSFDVEYLTCIASEFAKLEERDIKTKSKVKRKR